MTQDEIIEIAKEAGFMLVTDSQEGQSDWYECFTEEIVAFAKLVEKRTAAKERADEREACALLVEREWSTNQEKALCDELASYIRARGEQHEH